MLIRTLITALVLASLPVTLTTANAGPVKQQFLGSQEAAWMDRASQNFDGPGAQ
jgi:hypothetical protein